MTNIKKYLLVALAAAVILVAGFFIYIKMAFPEVRCEGAKHLERPEDYMDCVTCHEKTTVKVTQDWKDSKHGVMLVKCFVCHGEPDGKGALPFAVNPDPKVVCAQCHDPSMKRMVQKYGEDLDCNTCHPSHQNPMHGNAYENKLPTTKTTLDAF